MPGHYGKKRKRKKSSVKNDGLLMKVKGVDVSKLTKSQQKAMKKHSVHHTKKHINHVQQYEKRCVF